MSLIEQQVLHFWFAIGIIGPANDPHSCCSRRPFVGNWTATSLWRPAHLQGCNLCTSYQIELGTHICTIHSMSMAVWGISWGLMQRRAYRATILCSVLFSKGNPNLIVWRCHVQPSQASIDRMDGGNAVSPGVHQVRQAVRFSPLRAHLRACQCWSWPSFPPQPPPLPLYSTHL